MADAVVVGGGSAGYVLAARLRDGLPLRADINVVGYLARKLGTASDAATAAGA